jgi:hypothetical protein
MNENRTFKTKGKSAAWVFRTHPSMTGVLHDCNNINFTQVHRVWHYNTIFQTQN